jgi:hypothetical protein
MVHREEEGRWNISQRRSLNEAERKLEEEIE